MTSYPEGTLGMILQGLLLVPFTLLPIMNPLTTASVFVSTLGGQTAPARRLARQIAINSFVVLVAAMLVGTYVLSIFGISLPVVRIGGGLLVAATGWRMLGAREESVQSTVAEEASALTDEEVMRHSFLPMTFPLTTGPGTIAACIALGAKVPASNPLHYLLGVAVAVGGALVVVAALYLILRHSVVIITRLGPTGALVLQQLMAFILLCIGIELIWGGVIDLEVPIPG